VGLIAVACGGDGHAIGEGDGGADASSGQPDRDAAVAEPRTCENRCQPDEGLDAADCSCSRGGVHMRLAPLSEGFYAQPWPLATRLHADGTLDLSGFPAPPAALFITANLATIEGATHGFSTNGAIFIGLDGALDPDTLPSAEESLRDQASAYLIEVEPDSATLGERTPIGCSVRAKETAYTPANLLACAPVPGFPLRGATHYALVITDAVRDANGDRLHPLQRLRDLLAGDGDHDSLAAELVDAYAPLASWLDDTRQDGLRDHIVAATVFATQDPTAEMRALAADVKAQPAPSTSNLVAYGGTLPAESGNYVALEGTYASPIYQQGDTPYALSGGDIRFANGKPLRAAAIDVRFALTLPNRPMPAGGWPIVLYHHGTGGDAYSFIEDGTAYHLAAAGVAAIGIDAPVHGTRKPDGADPQLLFFNINNVLALRDNIRQGAVDLLALERFVTSFVLTAAQSPTGNAIRFDGDGIFAMGHSQGGLTVPLMLPFADHVRAAMLSGAGASITASILYKKEPLDIPGLARGILALEADEPLDELHPVLALVQAFSDVSDSSNYAPYAFRWQGGRGLDVWATQGLEDTFAPPAVTNALVTAYGLQPMSPLAQPVAGLELRGIEPVRGPVYANIECTDGMKYTGVYSQYPGDDHFLIMTDPDAEEQLTHWFQTLARGGHAELIAP
jgi:hypothetical protein